MLKEFSGKTLDEALEAAVKETGIAKENLKYEESKNGGFLGLFKSITISVEIPDEAKEETVTETIADAISEVRDEVTSTKSDKPVDEIACEFVLNVLTKMGIEANVSGSIDEAEETVYVEIEGPDMGVLIGKRGQTLDSLQYLASLVVNRASDDKYYKVKLDTENYRARRKDTLENLAKNISNKVRRTRRPVVLEPMNPYERRLIHFALQNDKYVETHSEGEEPYRKVVVSLKKDAPRDNKYQGRNGGRFGGNRNGGRYGNNNYYNKKRNFPKYNGSSEDYSEDYKADYAAYLESKAKAKAEAEGNKNN